MQRKICTICKKMKNKSEYNKNKTRKDGLQNLCRACSNNQSKFYYKENKEIHKKMVRARNVKIISENQQKIVKFLKKNPCKCGEKDICCLDFDHISNKSKNISTMLKDAYSWESIKKEIAKCQVLCANCHRRKTAKNQKWYKLEV